jgi:molecular chaperone GrpE
MAPMNEDEDVTIESEDEDSEGGSEEELEASESRAETKIAKLRKELEHVKKEKQENQDGWQRSKADYVNAIRRFEEEKKNAVDVGKTKAALAFIPAMDSLERAKAHGEIPGEFAGIIKQLEHAAKSVGLEQFGEKGEHFNPMLHEALGQDPTNSKDEDDVITQVLETGWKLGDLIVRPAKVRVAYFES